MELVEKLQDKEYRDAFVASQINIALRFQVRTLREERELTQGQLAEKAGMMQPRISAIETPGKGKLNLETLLRIASALDVGLVVRFAPFSEIVEWAETFSPDSFTVPSFTEDMTIRIPSNKYRNVPTLVDGVRFASKGEAQRWQELKLLEKGGIVTELRRQVRYSIDVRGHHICAYVADFVYREKGYLIVEDFKGKETPEYRLKKKLMLACHGITIKETHS